MPRRKQCAYNRARDSNKDSDWEKFRSVRKEVQKDTKRAYWSYVRNTCLESPKQFWGFIKRLKNDTCGIQSLRENGKFSSDSTTKANILNRQFESVFTEEESMSKIDDPDVTSYPAMPGFTIMPEGVAKLLKIFSLIKLLDRTESQVDYSDSQPMK